MDAHAGRGGVGLYIAEQGYQVTLIDYNEIAFNQATQARAKLNNVDLITNDIAKYAREKPASVYALHAKDPWDGNMGIYADNIIGAISIFQDLLEPDGHLLISSIHMWGYITTYLLMKQLGFNKINVSSWTPQMSEVEKDWYLDGEPVKRYVLSCRKNA